MAMGSYLSTKADAQRYDELRRVEETHIDLDPDGERAEVREILRQMGVPGEYVRPAADGITADRERWVDLMMAGEYGLTGRGRPPLAAGLATFAAFLVLGLVPLLPYILRLPSPFLWASVSTAFAFTAVGALKGFYADGKVFGAIVESITVGSLAAVIAWSIGRVLSALPL